MSGTPKKPRASTKLFEAETRGVWRSVNATFSPNKGLEVSLHDLGDGATVIGDEYECWYKVSPAKLEAFCELVGIDPLDPLVGLSRKYRGENFDDLKALMADAPMVRFSSYW